MIYKDEYGFPVDQTGDGGDSAMRNGILMMCDDLNRVSAINYSLNLGEWVRHSTQRPWTNPKNFSRDQLIVFIAGINKEKWRPLIEMTFRRHAKRLFFCQNTERDKPGTTKYPWPHTFENDKGVMERRLFDFADPLFPNHIGMLIIAARMYVFYPFLLVAYPWHVLKLALRALNNPKGEENQTIAECFVYGTLKLYRRLFPKWQEISAKYWGDRNEIEYHEMLVKFVEEKTR